MFGIFRFTLACMVALAHFGNFGPIGSLAVHAFFILSGFLMTMLVCTVYKGRPGAFALNRFLRLYPNYWFAMALTALLLTIGMRPPSAWIAIPDISSLVPHILYITISSDHPQLILTAWAVSIEIVIYVLIGLGLSKTPWRTLVWFVVSIIYMQTVYAFWPTNKVLTYFSPMAASLPFATGALAYHLRQVMPKPYAVWVLAASVLALAAGLCVLYLDGQGRLVTLIFLASVPFLVVSLFFLVPATELLKLIDDWLGSLSYPIYLIHFTAAFFLPKALPTRTFSAALFVLGVSILISIVMVVFVDRPVERIRKSIRAGRSQTALRPYDEGDDVAGRQGAVDVLPYPTSLRG